MLLLLYGFLIVSLLVLVYSGASLYSAVEDARQGNGNRRSALSFVQSQVAGCRTGVTIKPGPEGQMLCLPEADTAYETRIFLYRGELRTAFVPEDDPLEGEAGAPICPASEFGLAWQGEGLLRISADGAVGYAACLRGEGYDG